MKNLLIIETEYIGHYLTGYIKYILRALDKKNIKICLLLSDETLKKGMGALKILKDEKVKFHIETIKNVSVSNKNIFSLSLYQLKLYFLIKKKFNEINKEFKFDHAILTSIQRIDKIISILGSPFGNTKFSGIFLGLKFHLKTFNIQSMSTNNILSKFLFYRLLKIKTLLKIITNDHLLEKYIKKKKWINQKKILFLHDPKEFNYRFTKKYARKKLKINSSEFTILVYGAIIESKGIKELLQIFRIKNHNAHCLIVGKQIGLTKKFLKKNKFVKYLKKNNKISIYDGWQDEKKEAIFFSASDAIWIGYKNYHSPSGVLYQAVSAKKPSILSNDSFINELNKSYKIGISTNINNPHNILKSMNLIKNPKEYSLIKKNIKQFYDLCRPVIWVKNFKDFILKAK